MSAPCTDFGFDDTFYFTCKACGKCCKHREDILLNPYDLFRIASYLGRTPREIIQRYCEGYEGHTSHFPVVRVVPVPPDNAYPFLRNKKCAVYAKKPTVCRVHPLARMFTEEGASKYLMNGSNCRYEPTPITVREWIADIASEEAKQAGRAWTRIVTFTLPQLQPGKFKVSAEERRNLFEFVIESLWLVYDTEKPFLPQLERNFE